jgi:hypothetical protein
MPIQRDVRRYGVIEVHRINAATYHLIIGDEMWSEVEWSETRQVWCIQDAAGRCLLHVEHIVGQDLDPQAAIRIAKKMIVDGRMPAPEEALAQLTSKHRRREQEKAFIKLAYGEKAYRESKAFIESRGEPFVMDPIPEKEESKSPISISTATRPQARSKV